MMWRDAQIGIVGAGRQVIGRHAVAAQQREVFDIGSCLGLLAVHAVVKAHVASGSRGTRKRSTNGSPAAARRSLSSRESSRIPGLNSQVPPRRDFLAFLAMRGSEIAVGHALREIALGGLPVQGQPLRIAGTARPSRDRASSGHRRSNRATLRVLRPTSVSSMRRIMVPPLRRAYNQLKMKVRALPM